MKTEDELELEKLSKELDRIREEQESVWGKYQLLRAKMLRVNYDKATKKGLSPKVVMSLPWDLLGNVEDDGVYDEVKAYFDTWEKKGVQYDGSYYGDCEGEEMSNCQPSLDVRLDKRRPLSEQMGIAEWLPYIKALEGKKIIGISECTLSEHGVYLLKITGRKYSITKTTYGHESVKAEFPSLLKAMEYIYEKHPAPTYD